MSNELFIVFVFCIKMKYWDNCWKLIDFIQLMSFEEVTRWKFKRKYQMLSFNSVRAWKFIRLMRCTWWDIFTFGRIPVWSYGSTYKYVQFTILYNWKVFLLLLFYILPSSSTEIKPSRLLHIEAWNYY